MSICSPVYTHTYADAVHEADMAREREADMDVDLSGTGPEPVGQAVAELAAPDALSGWYRIAADTVAASGLCAPATALAVLDLDLDRTGAAALSAGARAVAVARTLGAVGTLNGAMDRRREPLQLGLDAVIALVAVREDIRSRLGC